VCINLLYVLPEIGGQWMLLEERSRLNQMDSHAIIHQVEAPPVHLDGYPNAQRHRTGWFRRAVLLPSPRRHIIR